MRGPIVVLLLAIPVLAGCTTQTSTVGPEHLATLPDELRGVEFAPGFEGGNAWLNTDNQSITIEELRGQVVLVDFWTYTCVNCIRTFPHITALYDNYRDHGFVLIGVHSPEFEVEKNRTNVEKAIEEHGINYPVVQDNEMRIWRAYANHFWPAHYLIDHEGKFRAHKTGEGGYAQTEQLVRQLLFDAGQTNLPAPVEEGVDTGNRGSDVTRELYAGTFRQRCVGTDYCPIGNSEGYNPGQNVTYEADGAPTRDRIFFDGTWHNGREMMTTTGNGSFYLLFKAGAANFVADAPAGVCIPVTLDGQPISREFAGPDVQFGADGPCIMIADYPRSYDFYAGQVEEHEVGFHVPANFSLYTFAFSAYAQTK